MKTVRPSTSCLTPLAPFQVPAAKFGRLLVTAPNHSSPASRKTATRLFFFPRPGLHLIVQTICKSVNQVRESVRAQKALPITALPAHTLLCLGRNLTAPVSINAAAMLPPLYDLPFDDAPSTLFASCDCRARRGVAGKPANHSSH